MRTEKDFLGKKEIPKDVLYGINSVRAKENFTFNSPFNLHWYKAMGMVKYSCYETYASYKDALKGKEMPIDFVPMKDEVVDALVAAASEVMEGKHYHDFIVPAISGGAGTSINMNVNEIIANRALQLMGKKPGDYAIIDPIEQANIFQSTNDVVPTALKLAAMKLLETLEKEINLLRKEIEDLEKKHRNDLRISYTQMQEAVPSSYGKLFSAYCDALSRDWWRVSKCFERIKVINLGGSAIGTGITVPQYFIMNVSKKLQSLSQLPLSRSENMVDATQNLDAIVEVHGILKAQAVNLEKMTSDLRLLSSSLVGKSEIQIPDCQTGSSIMPGKVNPVIPEYVISSSHIVYANDMVITSLCGQACLELNAYVPVIGSHLLNSIELLISSCVAIREKLIKGLKVNVDQAMNNLYNSPSVCTAFIPLIGYHAAGEIAQWMKEHNSSVHQANKELKFLSDEQLENLLRADYLLKLGFNMKDFK